MDVGQHQRKMDQVISNSYVVSELSRAIYALEGDSMESKLDNLNRCNCCERHQTNKPSTLSPWQECVSNGLYEWSWANQFCGCDCRHMARWICRTCNDDTSSTQENLSSPTTTSITGITENAM